jgi:hypothetical protein
MTARPAAAASESGEFPAVLARGEEGANEEMEEARRLGPACASGQAGRRGGWEERRRAGTAARGPQTIASLAFPVSDSSQTTYRARSSPLCLRQPEARSGRRPHCRAARLCAGTACGFRLRAASHTIQSTGIPIL